MALARLCPGLLGRCLSSKASLKTLLPLAGVQAFMKYSATCLRANMAWARGSLSLPPSDYLSSPLSIPSFPPFFLLDFPLFIYLFSPSPSVPLPLFFLPTPLIIHTHQARPTVSHSALQPLECLIFASPEQTWRPGLRSTLLVY